MTSNRRPRGRVVGWRIDRALTWGLLLALACGAALATELRKVEPSSHDTPSANTSNRDTSSADWPQWGGPQRDFVAAPVTLGNWPEDGPTVLWRRPLGEGYSAISVVGSTLYTHYREDDTEVILAAAVETGRTLWEYRYPAPILNGMMTGYGRGPHSTPLLIGGRLFAIGSTGRMHALLAVSGEVLWQVDLWGELGGTFLRRGYGSSPIAWQDTVLVTLGGVGQGVVALDQATGQIRWKRQDLESSPSSPRLIEVDGETQLIAFVADEVVAMSPDDGRLLWRHGHPSGAAYNISMPMWDAEQQLLFMSSAYGGGGRVLHLTRDEDGVTQVEELWHHSRFNLHFTNGVRLGDHVYGSSGRSTVMLEAVSIRDGEIAWRERAIHRANFVVVGDRVVALEEDGRLLLMGLTPEHPIIYSQTQLFNGKSWTVPTLVGHRLYVRNNEEMVALELPSR